MEPEALGVDETSASLHRPHNTHLWRVSDRSLILRFMIGDSKWLACDQPDCGAMIQEVGDLATEHAVRTIAAARGWYLGNRHYCPQHWPRPRTHHLT